MVSRLSQLEVTPVDSNEIMPTQSRRNQHSDIRQISLKIQRPFLAVPFLVTIALMLAQVAKAGEAETESSAPLNETGMLVQFERDIAPILQNRCLKCHGPEEAKEDFRVDVREVFFDYIEPGDVAASILYTEYLTAEDVDSRMPPQESSGPLSPGELALIRVWIDEGASWPVDFQMTEDTVEPKTPAPEPPKSLGQRLFAAIGYLHPAIIHFPIALFTFGALFVVVGLKWPSLGTQIPLACLLIGTASAITAATMGWSLAPTKGYDPNWEFLNFDRDVDAHRWSAVIVTTVACISSLVALIAIIKNSSRLQQAWKVGLLACGIGIGLVGHQGGEMTYGRDFYPEMLRVLFGETEQVQPVVEEPLPVASASPRLPSNR